MGGGGLREEEAKVGEQRDGERKESEVCQTARHLIRENLSPLRRGIERQLIGLRKNVDRLALSDNIVRSKALGGLIVGGSN